MSLQKKHLLYGAVIASAMTLAACGSNNNDDDNGNTPPTPSATTLAAFMAQLFGNTTETATPVEINTLNLDTTSEEPTQFNALII